MTDRDEELLADLLLRWEELRDINQEVTAAELSKDHPYLQDELQRRIDALLSVAWLDKPLSLPPDDRARLAPDQSDCITLAGRYRLENLIAEGGFAKVWRAYDQLLERYVAIKIARPTRIQSPDAFLAEARRLAKLNHPGIVPVYDVGIESGVCFIVSELINSGTLQERMKSQRFEIEQAIAWTIQIADALSYAHQQGIVHQDIKPANILIDSKGEARLTDFGIHQSAQSIGTLRYMSPEQLNGMLCDSRTDIYSLAVVLHELLSGEIPYSTASLTQLRRSILEGASVGSIPRPFNSICSKALSSNVADRYATASEFSAELKRALQPQKKNTFYWKTAIAILLVLAFAGWLLGDRRNQPSDQGITVLQDESQFISATFIPPKDLLLVSSLPSNIRLQEVLKDKTRSICNYKGLKDWVRCVDCTTDGRLIVAGSGGYENEQRELIAGKDNIALLWDANTGNQLRQFGPIDNPITAIAISPDKKQVATGSDDGIVRIWDVETGALVYELKGHGPMVRSVKFVPERSWLVSAGLDAMIRIWDLETGQEIRQIKGHVGGIESIDCSSNGKWIVSGSKDNTVRLWDLQTGQAIHRFDGHLFQVMSVCFSPDNRHIVSGSFDRTIRLWDIESGRELHLFSGHTNGIKTVGFSSDGKRIVSGGVDRTVRVWHVPKSALKSGS